MVRKKTLSQQGMLKADRDKWSSPTQAMRKRKKVTLTLSPEAMAKLARLSGPGGKSELVERLIMDAPEPRVSKRRW